MDRVPKAVHTPEYRAEAVKLVEIEGLSAGQAAKRLLVPKDRIPIRTAISGAARSLPTAGALAGPGPHEKGLM